MARGIVWGSLTRGKPQPDLNERLELSKLKRYLLADELPILAQRQHWAALWKTFALVLGGLFVVVALALVLPPSLDNLNPFLLLCLLFLIAWAGWKWLVWKGEWLVATDKRLLLNYGVINEGVVMVSLSRIIDLTYSRSRLGRMLGYGELERESQKHPNSMHQIKWVKDPDRTYLTICAAIFNLQDRMFGMEVDEYYHKDHVGDPPPHAPGLVGTPAGTAGPIKARDEPDQGEDPPGIRIHYGVSRHNNRDPWHESPDLRDSPAGKDSLRDADTGPIPYRRSSTDEGGNWRPSSTDQDPDNDHRKNPDKDR
jgi:hypothetical protein